MIALLFVLINSASAMVASYPWSATLHVTIQGPIDAAMSKSLREIQIPESVKTISIDLDSMGGDVEEALKIIAVIQKWKAQNLAIVTTVRNGRACGSMCVPLFVQGDTRRAGPVANFMFHSVHYSFLFIGQVDGSARNNDAFLAVFRDAKVSKAWLDSMIKRDVFRSPQMYWMSAQDLVNEKSNVVTELLPRLDKAPSIEIGGVKIWF